MKKPLYDPLLWMSLAAGLVIFFITKDHVFFWDTIQLGAKQATWLYEQGLTAWLLPDRIDSGHPPAFGAYLAAWWRLFGRSLWVSHAAMIPWLWLLLYQLAAMARSLGHGQGGWIIFALVIVDPVLLGQLVLISPDVVLAGCFLLAWRMMHGKQRRWWLALALLGLSLISLRGMMIAFALGVYELLLPQLEGGESWRIKPIWRRLFSILPTYLPGLFIALAFLGLHFQAKGWIGYHADSPWAPSFEQVGLGGSLRNLAVLIWRWLDVGRVVLWLAGLVALLRIGRYLTEWWWPDIMVRRLLGLLVIVQLVLAIPLLGHGSLLAHRYLLPAFLVFSLLVAYTLYHYWPGRKAYVIWALVILGFFYGNFWRYPDHVSRGWDATLAHLPYYEVRDRVIDYARQNDLPLADIGTAFPEIGPLDDRDLSGRQAGFVEKDLERQSYIFYSNVMNDFTDEELTRLQSNWTILFETHSLGIRGILYRHAKTTTD